jgi:L-gulonate 3-dehydrogenase
VKRVAVIGAGLVGRGWAIVFARASLEVALFDNQPEALGIALEEIHANLLDLQAVGLLQEAPAAVLERIQTATTLEEALANASYVQENVLETSLAKWEIFTKLDEIADKEAILASSSSGIMASSFTEGLKGRQRCLIAHPLNPPYLIPLVELAPAPWTAREVITRSKAFLASVGQVPVLVKREIPGFILNRLQGALLNEAFRLAGEGYMSVEDIDKTVAYGLGLRWSFMGPFETIDLNAPAGLKDYALRYRPMYRQMMDFWDEMDPWTHDIVEKVEAERCALLPREALAERRRWRDRRLMALAAHQQEEESRG